MKYYISTIHNVISNNPKQCEYCDSHTQMVEITQEEAQYLINQYDEFGNYTYWHNTDLKRTILSMI